MLSVNFKRDLVEDLLYATKLMGKMKFIHSISATTNFL